MNIPYCNRCGSTDVEVVNEDQGYAYCGPCEDEYQAALRAEYPLGQCQECGATGRAWTCPQGKVHTVFMHSEGGCRHWRDSADNACTEGCQPARRAVVVLDFPDDELPF